MLTPAEEVGLSGSALAGRVQRALRCLSEAALARLIDRLREAALEQHLVYLHDGELEPVRILPCPVTVLPDQLAYIHYVSLGIQNALKRLPELYFQDSPCARSCASRRTKKLAVGMLGAEPAREQSDLRPARRGDRFHQPDVEELAPLHGAQHERHRRAAHGADRRAAHRRRRAARLQGHDPSSQLSSARTSASC